VVVENRPGAGGTIGIAALAKSPPDGYTLAVVSTGHVVNPVLYANLPYDTIKDLSGVAPIARPALRPGGLAPARGEDREGFVAHGQGEARQLTTPLPAPAARRISAPKKFRMAAGIDAVHVPLKGSPESLTETMGGRTHYSWTPLSTAVGQIKEGRLLALAVSTAKRSPQFPEIPTIAEAGFPKAEFNFWVGMLAPAGDAAAVLGADRAEAAAGVARRREHADPELNSAFGKPASAMVGISGNCGERFAVLTASASSRPS